MAEEKAHGGFALSCVELNRRNERSRALKQGQGSCWCLQIYPLNIHLGSLKKGVGSFMCRLLFILSLSRPLLSLLFPRDICVPAGSHAGCLQRFGLWAQAGRVEYISRPICPYGLVLKSNFEYRLILSALFNCIGECLWIFCFTLTAKVHIGSIALCFYPTLLLPIYWYIAIANPAI